MIPNDKGRSKLTARAIAKAQGISHTTLYEMVNHRKVANSRGVGEQFQRRIMTGEKHSKVLSELLPDIAKDKKELQQCNQFRSTSKWMLNNGFSLERMICYLCECAGRLDVAEQVEIYLQQDS